jgi:hypothetical protein
MVISLVYFVSEYGIALYDGRLRPRGTWHIYCLSNRCIQGRVAQLVERSLSIFQYAKGPGFDSQLVHILLPIIPNWLIFSFLSAPSLSVWLQKQ